MSETPSGRTRLLGFARQVGTPRHAPEDTARTRGWLDEAGEMTKHGKDVLKSLSDQQDTRVPVISDQADADADQSHE